MTKEMKLLMALCEALGFEVETTLDYAPRKEHKDSAMEHNGGRNTDRVLVTSGAGQSLDIDADGRYTSILKSPIIGFKLERAGQ